MPKPNYVSVHLFQNHDRIQFGNSVAHLQENLIVNTSPILAFMNTAGIAHLAINALPDKEQPWTTRLLPVERRVGERALCDGVVCINPSQIREQLKSQNLPEQTLAYHFGQQFDDLFKEALRNLGQKHLIYRLKRLDFSCLTAWLQVQQANKELMVGELFKAN